MQTSVHEDYLEWILENRIESLDDDTLQVISKKFDRSRDMVRNDLNHIESTGDIILGPGTAVQLTKQGRKTAECILKKHKTLECFLTEMLGGMDQDTASQQACRMEHETSNDTISRLNRYLSRPGRCRQERRRGCAQPCDLKPPSPSIMKKRRSVWLLSGAPPVHGPSERYRGGDTRRGGHHPAKTFQRFACCHHQRQ
ncbi:metal-dependent transcriptional regulator [Methanogenium cariaci]|uniref:metal-dependent transcriptional regulator n=1 Tax=Methanogenium cariaci TaxID=2197 RepID=UPI000781AB34|nr:iron dependent repressor, metal binding and dimerization domain protein [Methanogenium cariaci]